jgi:hypothetical protein
MKITPSTLTRGAAVATMMAGLIYIVIQPLHPKDDLELVIGTTWFVVHALSLTMAVLALAGLTGIYLRQVRESGLVGLIGYVLFSLFFVLQAAFTFAEAFIAPLTAAGSPELTEDLVGLFAGHTAQTDLGALAVVPFVGVVFYVVGGMIFGVALLRARVLSRWAAILLIAASAITLLAGLLPGDTQRLLAIPVGIALVWLGYSLWSEQRKTRQTTALLEHRNSVQRSAV